MTVNLCGENITVVENYITPISAGVSVNNEVYYLLPNTSDLLTGTNCYIRLLNISYLPIEESIALELYYNSTIPAGALEGIYKVNSTNITKVGLPSAGVNLGLSVKPSATSSSTYAEVFLENVSNTVISYNGAQGYVAIKVVNVSIYGNAISANVYVSYPNSVGDANVIPFHFANDTWSKVPAYYQNSSSDTISLRNYTWDGLLGLFIIKPETLKGATSSSSTVYTTIPPRSTSSVYTTTIVVVTKPYLVNYLFIVIIAVSLAVALTIAYFIYRYFKKKYHGNKPPVSPPINPPNPPVNPPPVLPVAIPLTPKEMLDAELAIKNKPPDAVAP